MKAVINGSYVHYLFLFTGLLCLLPQQAQALSELDACLLERLQQAGDETSVGELKAACQASLIEQAAPAAEAVVAEDPPVSEDADAMQPLQPGESLVDRRLEAEKSTRFNPFVMSPHKQNYVLLASYNDTPNYEIYNIPASDFDRVEMKFQFSFKMPVYEGLFGTQADLYAAYSNLSFWQAYNRDISSPFRETVHEPEMFVVVPNNWKIFGWKNSLMQFGAVHQSNGQGGFLSRSWNRLYANFVFENDRFLLGFKPWYRVPEDNDDNPDIEDYLGHYELTGLYKKGEQTFGLMLRNLFDDENRATMQLDWSFPLYRRWRGYVQYFNGYGEGLIDYNSESHRIGFGLQLTDWL